MGCFFFRDSDINNFLQFFQLRAPPPIMNILFQDNVVVLNLTKQERNMRKRFTSIFTVLVVALMALFVSCEQNTTEPLASSISVRVADQTGARTITPEGNVNISHYVITVVNEAEDIEQSSGYLTKGSMFTVSNVPAGTWYAKVDAYIDRGSDTYVKVASDQSEPKAVAAGSSTVFDLVLDTLDEVVSGDVTVTLKMPTALSVAQSTTGTDELATITIDADTINLMQGAYRFEITVQDAEISPTLTRKGVDVMRLINGLEASGTIDLATYESDQSFDVTITDKIGDILTPSIQDGKPLYELDAGTGNSLTVALTEALKANETIEWYVDGELDETVNTDNATSGQYTLTFTNGSHSVTAIVRNTDTQMSVGSVSFLVENTNVGFEETENLFTFELNEDQQSYTLTGLAQEIGEFEMPESGILEIPASYQGKPVTRINGEAFSSRTDIEGKVVIPEGISEIGYAAFCGCSSLTKVRLPSTLATIRGGSISHPEGAFKRCSALTEINIPDSVTSIGNYTFQDCSALTNINIPNSVTSIGDSAFQYCESLETVNISDSSQLTSISYRAFDGCSALKNIIIPDSVTSIGFYAFDGCSALDNIYCEAASQPEDWDADWLGDCDADVFWGVSRSEYEAIINNDSVPYSVPEPIISYQETPDGMAHVDISCEKDFAHIYYTTDGTNPTADNGTLFGSEFSMEISQINQGIKAVAYVGNNIYSSVDEYIV